MSSFKTTTTKTKTTTYIMVMEKALPQLPTELVKNIEELAGIYREPGYKELSESLKFLSSSNAIVLLDRETFVPKPRGRPRKGKVWHPKKGCWVDNGLLVFRVGPRNPAHGVSRKVLIAEDFWRSLMEGLDRPPYNLPPTSS